MPSSARLPTGSGVGPRMRDPMRDGRRACWMRTEIGFSVGDSSGESFPEGAGRAGALFPFHPSAYPAPPQDGHLFAPSAGYKP